MKEYFSKNCLNFEKDNVENGKEWSTAGKAVLMLHPYILSSLDAVPTANAFHIV